MIGREKQSSMLNLCVTLFFLFVFSFVSCCFSATLSGGKKNMNAKGYWLMGIDTA